MKTIVIDGVEYSLTPIEKKTNRILKQTLEFEVYPEDLGEFTWKDAKKACATLSEGWRLPTREELHLMWLNKDDSFAAANYWSSSEYFNINAWFQYFVSGSQYNYNKHATHFVRAVRDIK